MNKITATLNTSPSSDRSGDKDVLEVLGQKYSAEILAAATEPISAQELSDELDIPPATCYRRVDQLADAGLLTEYGVRRDGSREVRLFVCQLEKVSFNFDGGLSTKMKEQGAVRLSLDRIWHRITGWH